METVPANRVDLRSTFRAIGKGIACLFIMIILTVVVSIIVGYIIL